MERAHAFGCPCHWCGGKDGVEPVYEDQAPPSYDSSESEICNFVIDRIKQLTSEVRIQNEGNNMLQRSSGGNAASTSKRSSQAGGLPYIKPEHLSTEKRILSVLMARSEQDRWDNPSVVMKVRYDGKLFLWQVNNKNPNYDLFIDILGTDETKWAGNDVVVHLEQDPVTDRYYPRIEATEERSTKGRK